MYIFAIFLFFSTIIHALFTPEFSLDLEIHANILTASSQSIALLEDGRFIAVFSLQSPSNSSQIFGQFYDYQGAKLGNPFQISSNETQHRQNPCIAAQKDGSFVVVWEAANSETLSIYCRIYDTSATELVKEFLVNAVTEADRFAPAISLENSVFAVVWQGFDESGYGIYGQLFDFHGGRYSENELKINQYSEADQVSPSLDLIFVIVNSSESYVYFMVTWMSYGEKNANFGIFARFLSFSFRKHEFSSSDEFKISGLGRKNMGFPKVELSLLDHNFVRTPFFLIESIVVWQSENHETCCEKFCATFGLKIYASHLQIEISSSQQFKILKKSSEFQVNTFQQGDQTHPSVAFTKDNGFSVVWQSQNQDSDGLGIFSQDFDQNDEKIGEETQINVFTRGDQKIPCISSCNQGSFLVAWTSASMSEKGISLHANLYISDKIQLSLKSHGAEITVFDEEIASEPKPSIAVFPANGYFLTVWSDNYTYGQILDSQNQPVGAKFHVNMTETSNAVVAVLGENMDFVIIWEGISEGGKNIYGQLFDINTAAISDVIKISEFSEGEDPAVVGSKGGFFYVVWSGITTNDTNIHGQVFDSTGQKKYTTEFLINSDQEQNQSNPVIDLNDDGSIIVLWNSAVVKDGKITRSIVGRWMLVIEGNLQFYGTDFVIYNSSHDFINKIDVASNSSGYFIAVWQEIEEAGSGSGIFGQLFNDYFSRVGRSNFSINSYFLLDQISPSVSLNSNGFFIVWSSFLQDSDGFGIYGQFFDFYGHKIDGEIQINSRDPGNQKNSMVKIDESGNIIVIWSSFYGKFSIKAQKFFLFEVPDNSSQSIIGYKDLPSIGKHLSRKTVISDDGNYAFVLQDNGSLLIIDLRRFAILEDFDLKIVKKADLEKYRNFLYVGFCEESPEESSAKSSAKSSAESSEESSAKSSEESSAKSSEKSSEKSIITIFVINVEDSTRLSIVNSAFFTSSLADEISVKMKVFGDDLFMFFTKEFFVFSLKNPESPLLKSRFPNENPLFPNENTENTSDFWDFDVFSEDLFYVAYGQNLLIFHIVENAIFLVEKLVFSDFNAIKLNKNCEILYVGTNSGLKIYDISHLPSLILLKNLHISSIISLEISQNSQYLSVTASTSNFLMDISSGRTPILLKETVFSRILLNSVFSANSSFLLINCEFGLNAIKLIRVNREKVTPRLKRLAQQSIANCSYWSELSASERFLYIGDQENSVTVLDVTDPKGSSLPIVTGKESGKSPFLPGFYEKNMIFAINSTGIMWYNVVNSTKLLRKNSVFMKEIDDFLVTKAEDFLIVTAIDGIAQLFIVNITDETKPFVIGELPVNVTVHAFLSFSTDENTVFLTAKNEIFLINIMDKTKPKLVVKLKDSDASFLYISTISEENTQGNTYIFSANRQFLSIYEYRETSQLFDTFAFEEISDILINFYINAIKIVNTDYLAILGEKSLSLVNIHDKNRPVIIDTVSLRYSSSPNTKLAISSDFRYIYTPSVEVIGLYDSDFDLYPEISYNTQDPSKNEENDENNENDQNDENDENEENEENEENAENENSAIFFLITFCPVNMKSLTGVSAFLKLINIDKRPNWLTIDYRGFSLKLSPSSVTDLLNWPQPIVLTYVKQLQSQILEKNEISELQKAGFLDNELFITRKYDKNRGILISDQNLSEKRLNFIFSQNYFQRSFYFPIEEFLSLVPFPRKVLSLQAQFDEILAFSFRKADTRLDFQFSSKTFQDPDGVSLTFLANSLPSWLSFDKESRRFSGTPSFADVGNYTVGVIASNGFHSVQDEFRIEILYEPPVVNMRNTIQSQLKASPEVDIPLVLVLKSDSFLDRNNDTLTYEAFLENEGNREILPDFIVFHEKTLIFEISATSDELLKTFTLLVVASNKYRKTEDTLKFTIVASWLYVGKIIVAIVSPILSIYGLMQYRTPLFNVFGKRYYFYKEPENAIIECFFEKELYFIREDVVKAKILWGKLVFMRKLADLHESYRKPDFCEILAKVLKRSYEEIKGEIKGESKGKLGEIDEGSLQENGTIFVIIDCFIVYSLLKKHRYSQAIYDRIKGDLVRKHGKSWYFALISFDFSSNRNRKVKKFPEAVYNSEILADLIKNAIKDLKCRNFFTRQDSLENIVFLVKKTIKAEALGIPNRTKPGFHLLETSKGESILIDPLEIQEITTVKKRVKSSELQEKLGLNYYAIEMINNRKLPKWLDCAIKNGVLSFYGTPREHDFGEEFHVKILDSNGMIVRLFSIKIGKGGGEFMRRNLTLENLTLVESVKIERGENGWVETKIRIEKEGENFRRK